MKENKSDFIKDYLLSTFPDARLASGGSEVVMRCRFCGDSQKDMSAKHLYIKVADVPLFNCFKCNSAGILTDEIIRKYFLSSYTDKDMEFFYNLRSYNKNISKQIKTYNANTSSYSIRNNNITIDDNTIYKLNYINNRLGLQLTYNDLLQNKIVLNLLDLIQSNNINTLTRSKNIINNLNDDCIGFLSTDNGFVTLRNIQNNMNFRYNVYTIFNNIENSRKYYIIPSIIDVSIGLPINIHIAEGPFDILSIFYNLRGMDRNQNMYVAICGKSYIGTVKSILRTYGIINCIFHLYVDNDVDDYALYPIRNILHPLGIECYIHRNIFEGEKDFGVSLNKINESIKKL